MAKFPNGGHNIRCNCADSGGEKRKLDKEASAQKGPWRNNCLEPSGNKRCRISLRQCGLRSPGLDVGRRVDSSLKPCTLKRPAACNPKP